MFEVICVPLFLLVIFCSCKIMLGFCASVCKQYYLYYTFQIVVLSVLYCFLLITIFRWLGVEERRDSISRQFIELFAIKSCFILAKY